jgi:hypothetical protein
MQIVGRPFVGACLTCIRACLPCTHSLTAACGVAQALVQFAATKLQASSEAGAQLSDSSQSVLLPLEILAVVLRVLQAHSQAGPAELVAEVAQLQHHALMMHPELHALIVEAAAASVVPTPATSFAPDIEEEANLYFQKVRRREDGFGVIEHP